MRTFNLLTMNIMKGIVIGITAFILFQVIMVEPVYALEKKQLTVEVKNDIVISPGRTEIIVNKNKSATSYFTVTSRLGETRDFEIAIEDFEGAKGRSGGVNFLGKEKGRYSLKDWIAVDPADRTFSLKNGEVAKIPLVISVPDSAQPGGYYAAVFARIKPKQSELMETKEGESSGQVKIVTQAASLILLRVPGSVVEKGILNNFKTTNKIYFDAPIRFTYDFRNDGTIYLAPKVTIDIYNMLGSKVDSLTGGLSFVLPNSSRNDEINWSKLWLLGRYRADIKAVFGAGDEQIQNASTTFYVLNAKMAGILLGVLVFFYVLFHSVLSKFEIKKKR